MNQADYNGLAVESFSKSWIHPSGQRFVRPKGTNSCGEIALSRIAGLASLDSRGYRIRGAWGAARAIGWREEEAGGARVLATALGGREGGPQEDARESARAQEGKSRDRSVFYVEG